MCWELSLPKTTAQGGVNRGPLLEHTWKMHVLCPCASGCDGENLPSFGDTGEIQPPLSGLCSWLISRNIDPFTLIFLSVLINLLPAQAGRPAGCAQGTLVSPECC